MPQSLTHEVQLGENEYRIPLVLFSKLVHSFRQQLSTVCSRPVTKYSSNTCEDSPRQATVSLFGLVARYDRILKLLRPDILKCAYLDFPFGSVSYIRIVTARFSICNSRIDYASNSTALLCKSQQIFVVLLIPQHFWLVIQQLHTVTASGGPATVKSPQLTANVFICTY